MPSDRASSSVRNVQLNNLTFTGHDSVVADHGSTAHHDNS
jgi:hypothetical protein